ncbi:MAG TPA: DUF5916 domain-containing protein [Gemmatimonadaceae bacterium]|nr:DUF5916 domain-containing protein [Gemmatimonadaceae bacterium]
MIRTLYPGALRLACMFTSVVSAIAANAQQTVPLHRDSSALPLPGVTAVKGATPRLDGRLDDALWRDAVWIKSFTQREPNEGMPATGTTEVAFAVDDDALYIAGRMTSPDSSAVRALVTRRDREGSSEQLVISLDTYRDRRTAYSFGVTAAGVRIDYFHAGDAQSNRDYSFDPVWEAETQISGNGWTAEMRIPFTQLRFNRGSDQTWGVNVARIVPARNEEDYLVLVRRNETGWASRFAQLSGLGNLQSSRRVELVPYVASSAQFLGAPDARNPFVKSRSADARVGGDVKIGLGSSLTFDATINPDFGQVEADPAEVNLSAFETVFPERRPFFVEGSQLLRANQLSFFVSRRIGQSPRFTPSADYVERIQNTTILGAAKITGRLPSGLSVGALGALTGEENARTFNSDNSSFGQEVVEPRTGYGVVRLQQEFGKARSTAGFIFTGVRRDLESGTLLANLLPREAITGAAEWQLRFRGGEYVAFGTVGFSNVRGDSTAMLRLQRAPAHLYGRPDASHVRADPSRTSLTGTYTSIGLSKNAGKWLWQGNVYGESPGLDINDAGRIGSADDRGFNFFGRYRHTVPGKRLRSWDIGANNFNEWNYGSVRQMTMLQAFSNQTWRNFWQTGITATYFPRASLDNLTRGGPMMGYGANWSVNGYLATNPARKTQWRLTPTYGADEMDGWTAVVSGGISVRPGNQIELSVDPAYARFVNPRQFFANLEGGSDATFGRRYVFSYIERSELSARIRLNYALGTDLTLETYAEPFASSGRFFRLGELPAARSYVLREFGKDGTTLTKFGNDSLVVTDGDQRFKLPVRDFNILSFRSNMVLRWEWRPGSTAYLVWQQNRGEQRTAANLVRVRSLYDAITATGDNVFALKLSYWLPF